MTLAVGKVSKDVELPRRGHRILAGGEATGPPPRKQSRPGGAQDVDLILRPSRARIIYDLIPGAALHFVQLTPG